MRLLLDEHVDSAVAPGLRRLRAVEVVALRNWEQGAFLRTDGEIILRAARTNGWTLVTFDRASISPLLKEWGSGSEDHAGVIFVDERTFAQNDVGGLIRALVHLTDALGDVSWANRQAYLRH